MCIMGIYYIRAVCIGLVYDHGDGCIFLACSVAGFVAKGCLQTHLSANTMHDHELSL